MVVRFHDSQGVHLSFRENQRLPRLERSEERCLIAALRLAEVLAPNGAELDVHHLSIPQRREGDGIHFLPNLMRVHPCGLDASSGDHF